MSTQPAPQPPQRPVLDRPVLDRPVTPYGVKPNVLGPESFNDEYLAVDGYNVNVARTLASTIDEVEREIGPETYDRMENDPTINKAKRIIITGALVDEGQFAPGATEDEVGTDEYNIYVEMQEHCERLVGGLAQPYRLTLEQLLGNGLGQGHGIAEINWEYRYDPPINDRNSSPTIGPGSKVATKGQNTEEKKEPRRPPVTPKLRLMPNNIKVKPRGAALFVVDAFMNILGLVPAWARRNYTLTKDASGQTVFGWNDVIRKDKFLIFTFNKKDEDPRGRSAWRVAYNWWNFKQHIPQEFLRFLLQCAVPGAVAKLPKDAEKGWEYDRGPNNEILYEDPDTKRIPKYLTPVESMARAIKSLRNSTGVVLPNEAELDPFTAGTAANAKVFPDAISTADTQMENGILLQPLAQSEGEHQARSAADVHNDIKQTLIFYVRWLLAVCTLEMCATSLRINYGDWAVKYLPKYSLGDFERRDWAKDLAALADAYFKGFLDDTQRAELMAWMNLPKPGQSRAELLAESDPTTGTAVMPNKNRPDKQKGQDSRNDGNSKEKPNATGKPTAAGQRILHSLGYHGRRLFSLSRSA